MFRAPSGLLRGISSCVACTACLAWHPGPLAATTTIGIQPKVVVLTEQSLSPEERIETHWTLHAVRPGGQFRAESVLSGESRWFQLHPVEQHALEQIDQHHQNLRLLINPLRHQGTGAYPLLVQVQGPSGNWRTLATAQLLPVEREASAAAKGGYVPTALQREHLLSPEEHIERRWTLQALRPGGFLRAQSVQNGESRWFLLHPVEQHALEHVNQHQQELQLTLNSGRHQGSGAFPLQMQIQDGTGTWRTLGTALLLPEDVVPSS